MAKGGKLTKIKSVLKKMQSFKLSRGNGGSSIAAAASSSFSEFDGSASFPAYRCSPSSRDLHTVYVGKSRRRYMVGADIIEHPLFRELAEQSGESMTVGCEVVLFEHFLWMLENADPQPESLNELVGFYAC